jgi:hypothetical protein
LPSQVQTTLAELRTLVEEGHLTESAKYWSPGMDGWQSVQELPNRPELERSYRNFARAPPPPPAADADGNPVPPGDPKALFSTRKWWGGKPSPPPPPPPAPMGGTTGDTQADEQYGQAPSKSYQSAFSEEMGMAWRDYDANRAGGSVCKGDTCGVMGQCLGKAATFVTKNGEKEEVTPVESCIGMKDGFPQFVKDLADGELKKRSNGLFNSCVLGLDILKGNNFLPDCDWPLAQCMNQVRGTAWVMPRLQTPLRLNSWRISISCAADVALMPNWPFAGLRRVPARAGRRHGLQDYPGGHGRERQPDARDGGVHVHRWLHPERRDPRRILPGQLRVRPQAHNPCSFTPL